MPTHELNVTSGGAKLIAEASAQLAAGANGSALQFNFGFSTEEALAQQSFIDSVTLTVTAGPNLPLYLVTADVSGARWLPNTPGGFPLDPAALQHTPTSGEKQYPIGFDYFVSLSLPSQFVGQPLSLTLRLFDNQNALSSAAYLDNIRVVPEPGFFAIFLLGTIALLFWKKARTAA